MLEPIESVIDRIDESFGCDPTCPTPTAEAILRADRKAVALAVLKELESDGWLIDDDAHVRLRRRIEAGEWPK